jgi:signal transduction histidine kinase
MTNKTKFIAGLGAVLVAISWLGVLSYLSLVQNDGDKWWQLHTRAVIETLDSVLINALDEEIALRDYIIAGDQPYVEVYRHASGLMDGYVTDLRKLTADNPVQQRALDRLESLIKIKRTYIEDWVELRRRGGSTTGFEAMRVGTAKQLNDQIRGTLLEMNQEERQLLAQRRESAEASAQKNKIEIAILNVLAVVFLVAAGFVVCREMEQRRRAEVEVRALNANLEERTVQLQETARDLTRSNVDLEQFAYVASHDLQEPLRMVASFTQLLAERYRDKLDNDANDFIGYAVDGATRMQTLISDLLTYSRVGGQGKLMKLINCKAILERVLVNLKFAIADVGAVITHDSLPVTMGNDTELNQLFQNLLGNAIKFRGKDPPRVHVSSEPNETGWKISVRDNGIGISPEHRERIFLIFQRLNSRAEYAGTGIGLAICKKIVERYGGRIWIESPPEGGSIFNFTILTPT